MQDSMHESDVCDADSPQSSQYLSPSGAKDPFTPSLAESLQLEPQQIPENLNEVIPIVAQYCQAWTEGFSPKLKDIILSLPKFSLPSKEELPNLPAIVRLVPQVLEQYYYTAFRYTTDVPCPDTPVTSLFESFKATVSSYCEWPDYLTFAKLYSSPATSSDKQQSLLDSISYGVSTDLAESLDIARNYLCLNTGFSEEREKVIRNAFKHIENSELNDRSKAFLRQSIICTTYDYAKSKAAEEPEEEEAKELPPLTVDDITKTYSTIYNHLGCQHYSRNCKVRCPLCLLIFPCRLCHDEASDHVLPRFMINQMVCMICLTPQSPSQYCIKCKSRMSRYYCSICKLWDDSPMKPIYHCYDCGICRIGHGLGKDYYHCKTCNSCMAISMQDAHRCIENATECGCPICQEWLFTSRHTVVFMPCGHAIHSTCFEQYKKTQNRCPICLKSLGNLEYTFRMLDLEIASQPMTTPYNEWIASILCHDCSSRSECKFHFLGTKCSQCGSYNTNIEKIIKPENDQESDAG